MEKFELYLENENGQMVFNWEALELITDENFVNEIRKELFVCKGQVFNVNVSDLHVLVFIKTEYSYQIFRYNRKLKESFSDYVTKSEMDIINSHRKGLKK